MNSSCNTCAVIHLYPKSCTEHSRIIWNIVFVILMQLGSSRRPRNKQDLVSAKSTNPRRIKRSMRMEAGMNRVEKLEFYREHTLLSCGSPRLFKVVADRLLRKEEPLRQHPISPYLLYYTLARVSIEMMR